MNCRRCTSNNCLFNDHTVIRLAEDCFKLLHSDFIAGKTASVHQCRVQDVPLRYAFILISWMIISRRSNLSISSAASVVYIASSQQYTFLPTSEIVDLSINGSDSSSSLSSSLSSSFGSTVTVFLFRQLTPS